MRRKMRPTKLAHFNGNYGGDGDAEAIIFNRCVFANISMEFVENFVDQISYSWKMLLM